MSRQHDEGLFENYDNSISKMHFFQECLHHDISLMLDTTSSFNKYAVENKWVELVVKSHNNNSTTEDSPTN